MGHSGELMEALKRRVMQDWPLCTARYDKPIQGTMIRPDAAVYIGKTLASVYEVGYTDAAKIQAYRDMGIPDIRWFDKNMRLIVHETSNTKRPKVKTRPRGIIGVASELMQLRLFDKVAACMFGEYLVKWLKKNYPEGYGYFMEDIDCLQCEANEEECDGEGCTASLYYFFDLHKVGSVLDCSCSSGHEIIEDPQRIMTDADDDNYYCEVSDLNIWELCDGFLRYLGEGGMFNMKREDCPSPETEKAQKTDQLPLDLE